MNRKSIAIAASSIALITMSSGLALGGQKGRLSRHSSDGVQQRAGSGDLRLRAALGGGDAPQAKSEYRERMRNGTLEVRWKVSLEDFEPGVDVPVAVNGTFVGNIIPNALGAGVIQFRTSVDDPGDGNPLPDGFPRLQAGDTVSVGPLTGTYN